MKGLHLECLNASNYFPRNSGTFEMKFSHKEEWLLSKETDMLLKKGATVESKDEEGVFISSISLAWNPKASYRIILNLKKLDKNVYSF